MNLRQVLAIQILVWGLLYEVYVTLFSVSMGVAAAAAAGLGLANFALNPVLAEDGGIRAGYKKMSNIPVPVTVTTLRFRADRHGRIEDPGRKPEPKPAKEEPAVEPTPPEPAAGVVTKAFFKLSTFGP